MHKICEKLLNILVHQQIAPVPDTDIQCNTPELHSYHVNITAQILVFSSPDWHKLESEQIARPWLLFQLTLGFNQTV